MRLYTSPPPILTLVTWVPQSRLAFGQTPHVGRPSGLRPSAITILQCAALLAAGGYDRPCGRIKSLFLLSPARCLIVRPHANSSELSYSYSILLHHLSYTLHTILPGLGTADASRPSAKLRTQAGHRASGPRPSQSDSLQPCLPLAATMSPAGRSGVFFSLSQAHCLIVRP